jgi:exodeoxyribonuclease III
MKIATWNVNGIRARRDQFVAWISSEKPDIVCLQEIKASPAQIAETVAELTDLPAYINYWHGTEKGYSGVSLHIRRDAFAGQSTAFSHPSFDLETRIAIVRIGDLRIGSVYVPNGGKDYPAKLGFLRDLAAYARESHAQGAKLILCGDMNVARDDKDVHPSERKPGAIGQRADERQLFEAILSGGDLVDEGRALNPEHDRMFTWWPYWREARKRNIGWRIDYVLASSGLRCLETRISVDVGTSDHAPVIAIFGQE